MPLLPLVTLHRPQAKPLATLLLLQVMPLLLLATPLATPPLLLPATLPLLLATPLLLPATLLRLLAKLPRKQRLLLSNESAAGTAAMGRAGASLPVSFRGSRGLYSESPDHEPAGYPPAVRPQ
jgi:hypothetical protein